MIVIGRLSTALGGILLVGCTILPGLHVDVDSAGIRSTKSVSSNEEIRYLDQDDGPITAVRVITLDASNIVSVAAKATTSDSALPADRPSTEYQLGPGDVVSIFVWDHPELTNPAGEFRDPVSAGRLIDAQGMMFYPYIGSFKAAGMTTGALRDFVAQKIGSVITRPQVDARVVAFRSQRVQVSGEVRQPGTVTLDDTAKGIIDAIGERGGLSEGASRRRIELTRGGIRHLLDLNSLTAGRNSPVLLPGDQLHVPDRSGDQIFVLGEVNKEGPVFLQQQRTTLTEVLASAGGLNRTGSNDAGVLVFRRPGPDKVATVYRVSLTSTVGILTAGEFGLEPRDVVYVGSTTFSQYNSVINQLLPTISAIFQVDALVRSRN